MPPSSRGRYARDSATSSRDTTSELVHILQSLDRIDGAALRLIYFRGLTQDQAASALGLPPVTVRTCVQRGMHELARQLLGASS